MTTAEEAEVAVEEAVEGWSALAAPETAVEGRTGVEVAAGAVAAAEVFGILYAPAGLPVAFCQKFLAKSSVAWRTRGPMLS